MKSELEKLKAAVEVLTNGLATIQSSGHSNAMPIETAKAALDRANAILNPIEYETVEEIVGWVNVYQLKSDLSRIEAGETIFHTQEQCDAAAEEETIWNRISCHPIKVSVQREKKRPVERSVTVEAMIDHTGMIAEPHVDGFAHGGAFEFSNCPESFGKHVTLTATWEE
jgi:hypothetical protein